MLADLVRNLTVSDRYSSVLNNRPVTLGPDSLLSFNTGKGEVDNRGLMLRAYY